MEIVNNLLLELRLRGFRVFGTEGDPSLSGGIFRDDLFSSRRTDFERI